MKKIQIPLYILFLLLMIAFSVFCTLAIVWAGYYYFNYFIKKNKT